MKISKREQAILLAIVSQDELNPTEFCYPFAAILRFLDKGVGVTKENIKRIVHSMRDKGLLAYKRGLFNVDGEVAGAGYHATLLGAYLAKEGNLHPDDGVSELVYMHNGHFLNSDFKLTHDKANAVFGTDPKAFSKYNAEPVLKEIAPDYSPKLSQGQILARSLQEANDEIKRLNILLQEKDRTIAGMKFNKGECQSRRGNPNENQ